MKKIILLLLLITVTIGYSQTGIRKVTISNPPAFGIITANITNVTGFGLSDGMINLNAISGGTPASPGVYNISWTSLTNPAENVNTSKLKAGTYRVIITDSKGCPVEKDFIVHEPELINVKINAPATIPCFGGTGSVKAVASGGYPYGEPANYTYTWFKCDNLSGDNPVPANGTGPELSGVKEGYYMVQVIDNQNATIAKDVKHLTENPKITATEVVTHVSCRGAKTGSIKVIPSGGTPNTTYSIVWSDDSTIKSFERTGLTADTYRYTITDNLVVGCSSGTIPVKINQPEADFNVTYTSTQPTLTNNNGKITLTATGGILPSETPGYKYIWSKVGDLSFIPQDVSQRTDLGNGTYKINVTSSSGCSFPEITIKLEALNLELEQQTNIKCFGDKSGSLTVTASGGTNAVNGYNFVWFKNGVPMPGEITNKLTGLGEGTYRIELTDDETTVSNTYTIITEPSAALSATHTFTDVLCYGESNGTIKLNIQGGTTPYTVVFKNVVTTQTVNPVQLPKGTYSYLITDGNECTFPSPQNIVIDQKNAILITSITQKQPTLFSASNGEININAAEGTGNYTYILKKNTVVTEYPASPITGLGEGVYEVSVKDENNCTTAVQTITLKALAVAFVNKVDVTCNGKNTGSIEVLANGGTPITLGQYTYKWSYKEKATDTYTVLTGKITNKIENLYAGFYKVLVTDNVNISRELEIAELTERPAITCTVIKTEVNCFNGSDGTITLNIQGGTGDYHVTWNDNVTTKDRTAIPMGDYSFSITDDNGCSYSTTPIAVKITQPLKPLLIAASPTITNASGFGLQNGSISIVVSDGTFPYTYQWYKGAAKNLMTGKTNPLLNGIGADTYTVVVTDKNLCTTEATYTILEPAELLITAITEIESIKCFGYKEAVLKATITGGAPIGVLDADKNYIYRWYNELNPSVTISTNNPTEALLAGNYFLEVSDGFGNSFTSNRVTINEPTPVKISFTQTNVSCKNENNGSIQITTTGGTGLHTITWSVPSGANPNVIDKLYAGSYSVTVRDDNNCFDTQNFIITEPEILAIKSVVKTPPSAIGVDDASIAVTVQGGTPNYNFNWLDQNKNVIFTDNNQSSNTSIYNIYAGQYFISITDALGCTIIERDLDKVDPLFISLVQINAVQCFGDATASIKALTSGGLPGYYYKWYNVNNPAVVIGTAETLTNAKSGTYYVIATDSFDKSIQSENITINEPAVLANTLSSEYVRCGDLNDWTINSAVSGGTLPYTYLWNTGAKTPSLTDVMPGNYSLIVTDKNGCTITKNIILAAPAHLDASENIKIPTCYAGSDASIVVTTIAGIAPFTYLWNTGETSNTLSNAKAGTYSIEIKDAKGCIISRTYTIENPPKDVIDLGPDVTLCFDQTLTINATINDDQATYSWTSDKGFKSTDAMITVSEPAIYTAFVTNKLGCEATDSIQISSQNTAISAEFAVSSQVFLNEKIIVVDISNPIPDDVEWILPASAIIASKDRDYAEISFNEIGEHDITLITKKGNCVATQTKTIIVTAGEYEDPDETDLQKKFDLKIYPNPSDGKFTVDVMLDKIMPAHIKVYNLSNNQVIDSKYEEGKDNYSFKFSLNGLTSGIYFVLFESQQGTKLRKIIIK